MDMLLSVMADKGAIGKTSNRKSHPNQHGLGKDVAPPLLAQMGSRRVDTVLKT